MEPILFWDSMIFSKKKKMHTWSSSYFWHTASKTSALSKVEWDIYVLKRYLKSGAYWCRKMGTGCQENSQEIRLLLGLWKREGLKIELIINGHIFNHPCLCTQKKKLNENKGKDDPFPFPALAHASSCS